MSARPAQAPAMPSHVLARRDGIALVLGALFHMGALCATCGHGTRVTSKRWATCKKCGERVRRAPLPEASA